MGAVYEARNGVDGAYDRRTFSRRSRGFGSDMTRRAACLKPTKSDMYSVDCCPRVLPRMKSEVCIRLGADKILPYFLLYSVSQFYI